MNSGVQIFVEGARLALDRRLARYALLPGLIAAVIVGIGLTVALGYVGDFSDYLVAQLPTWLNFLGAVIIPVLYLIGVLIGAWLVGLLAVVVASPFLGDLSIEVERLKDPNHAPAHPPGFWPGIGQALAREGRKLGYHLPRLIGVFIITLIPVINAVSPFIWLLFGAWTMAVQFADYPAENRGLPFTDTLKVLKRDRGTALVFGGCTAMALAIPFLNFLLIPVAVAGRHPAVAPAREPLAEVPFDVAHDALQALGQPVVGLREADSKMRIVAGAEGVAGRQADVLLGKYSFCKLQAVGQPVYPWETHRSRPRVMRSQ